MLYRLSLLLLLALFSLASACANDDDDDDTVAPNDDDDVVEDQFPPEYDGWCESDWTPGVTPLDIRPPVCPDTHGSGAFGEWTIDALGDPAWTINAAPGEAWGYPTSTGTSTDVWHTIGNRKLNALVHLDGAVELFVYPLSPAYLNKRWDDQTAGGWATVEVIEKGGSGGSTRIGGHLLDQVTWGLNYVRIERTEENVHLVRYYYLDPDSSSLLVETRVTNNSGDDIDVRLTNYWDINLVYMTIFPVASGDGLDMMWNGRMGTGNKFRSSLTVQPEGVSIATAVKPDEEPPSLIAPLRDNLIVRSSREVTVCTDIDTGLLLGCSDGANDRDYDGLNPPAIGFTSSFTIAPGTTETEIHRIGTGDYEAAADLPSFAELGTDRRPDPGLQLSIPGEGWVARETAWHSSTLPALGYDNDRFGGNLIDQGSAYLYMQGASGAVRDWIITILAMLPADPGRARQILEHCLMFSDETGHLFYAMVGPSEFTEAGIHGESTDLDLWVLWGVAEYVMATRNFSFLDQVLPFYPPETGERVSVLEHVRRHYEHLIDATGTGANGMFRVGTGDWSDGVILFAPDNEAVLADGESAMNSAMAVHILPRIADLIESADAELAAAMRQTANEQLAVMEANWSGDHYIRGFDGIGGAIGADERVFLEPQVFMLMADLVSAERKAQVAAGVQSHLDERSDIGSVLVYPPKDSGVAELLVPGWDVNGGIWHAINQYLTAGYGEVDPAMAWQSWRENTFATHATEYPDIWFGILSGPDSYNSPGSDHPGATFWHPATSMADFPVTNSNAHAGPLYSAFSLAGLKPTVDGWRIDPRIPEPTWRLDSALASLSVDPAGIAARFTVLEPGPLTFRVMLPDGAAGATGVEGIVVEEGAARFTLDAQTGVEWTLTWE